ncbi:MAG: hypothetical protein HY207_10990 [Nitrospirae bacterium]|nr:hypothetical protein [Nitrospirota bacterium]
MSPFYLNVINPNHDEITEVNIRGDQIIVDRSTADLIHALNSINSHFVKPGEQLLIVPIWSAFYAILGRQSPQWEIYGLVPRTIEEQKVMIQQLNESNTNWVVLGDIAVDNREDLRFMNTHPYLLEYINKHFLQIEFDGLPENYSLYRRALGK